jgi:phosphate starvation-inducible PhoH-like protein
MAKRSRKTKNQQHQNNDVININSYTKQRIRHVTMIPKNLRQEDYIVHLDDLDKHEKIVVTRPAISVDEQHGFLPGTLEEKMAPWTRPIFDVFKEYWSPATIEAMIAEDVIEIAPLAYMRGRTFKNAYIIADEMQNATPSQMKMLLTRIGTGSRIIVTGDLAQHDRGYENNGLKDFVKKLKSKNSDMIAIVEFERQDVERHEVVTEVLGIYGDDEI